MTPKIFAESPSFVRQEIIDDSGDWNFWSGPSDSSNKIQRDTQSGNIVEVDRANSSEQCQISDDNNLSPDIQSVSYVSDGKTLNATVWLTSQFEEPPLNYTIDTFQEELMINITSTTNLTLQNYTRQIISYLLQRYNDGFLSSRPEEISNATLAGNLAHSTFYNNRTEQGDVKVMKIWTLDRGKAYEITYSALQNTYDEFLPSIQEMINTFEIVPSPSSSQPSTETSLNRNSSDIAKDFLPYETSEIKILYPRNWNTTSNDEATIIHFRSPFQDSTELPWREITFTMALDVDSVHESGIDYRVIYTRVPNSAWSGYWTKQITEVSAYDNSRVLEENSNYTDFNDNQEEISYILFSFDLSKVNFPERYKAALYITDYFIKDRKFCTLIDTTNWVIIPPPDFDMSTNPSSIELRPGQDKNIQIRLKSNTDLESEALLSANNTNDAVGSGIQLDISPDNQISIPASSSGSFSLNMKANNIVKQGSYTFPLIANISFPASIENRGGETFNNTRSVNIVESSNVTLTVLPQPTFQEDISNIALTLDPLNRLITLLVAVGSAVTPVLLYTYRKRKKNEQKSSST